MTTVVDPRTPSPLTRSSGKPAGIVALAAVVAVACRLPFLGHAAGADEAGFLLVGGQWNGGGPSLYGTYWVDRPPLLISIFQWAASMGGLTVLRLIGCAAVALLVLGSARVAGLVAGPRAALWAAVTAATLSITPLLGGYEVDAELLAAPIVVGGIAAVVVALRATNRRRSLGFAAGAGTLAMSALLVKQNFADVAVFGAAAFAVARWRHDISRQRTAQLTVAAAGGAGLVLLLVGWWTTRHGTSLAGVFDAMYPFRVRAGRVMAAAGRQHATERLYILIGSAVLSGLAVLLLVLVRELRSPRRLEAEWWALIATIAFGIASVLLGGNYWRHYLIELVAPTSIAIGVLAAHRRPAIRPVVAYAAVAAALAWTVAIAFPLGGVGTTVGTAIARSARPGDTIVTAYGHADLVEASGLSSPYAYLWSLPVKTLDPRLHQLDAVLEGPTPPTYFVTWDHLGSWGLTSTDTSAILARDYHQVAHICGRTVYLRNGIVRTAPRALQECTGITHRLARPYDVTIQ